jgi:hypothetical protein
MVAAIRIVALLAWGGIGFLLFLLWRIARFYERSSGRRAYSYLFLPPLLFLPAGAVCYILLDVSFVGNVLADLLFFLGGIFLVVATSLLGQIMIGEQ